MRLDNSLFFAGNALVERLENPISVKSFLLFITIIAIFVGLGIAISIAKDKKEEKNPQNLEEFFEDEVLETKKLERTLAVALLAVAVIAVGISIYFVWEPQRQAKMTTSFEERSVRRGQTLFANEGMKGYNAAQSLGCANCHGGYDEETGRFAGGGSASTSIKSLKDPATDPACAGDNKFTNADCITTSVSWKAPALNTVLYKFPIRKSEPGKPFTSSCRLSEQRTTPDCRSQVYDILTYGRPGTPMAAWGVAGGGPKNEQAIQDLVNFIASIQLPADEASQPIRSGEIIKQKKKIAEAKTALKEAKEKALEGGSGPDEVKNDEGVIAAQKTLDEANATLKEIESKTETQYMREAAITEAREAVATAQKVVDVEAPEELASAQADFDKATKAYESEPSLAIFKNPQDYLDKIEKDQTEIALEKKVETAKSKKDRKAERRADAELKEFLRLKNIAQNYLESRDALATAKATNEIFAPESLANTKARLAQLEASSDGQLLFESYCARCHTKGWSFFTPGNSRVRLPAPQGTGAFGPNLAGGEVRRQFVNPKDQFNFISSGSAFQTAYGSQGIGSGRMPGFNTVAGRILTDDQINAIVEYERNELTNGGKNSLGVRNLGSGTLGSN